MITRKQYMDHEYTHEEYFAQFVTDSTILVVSTRLGPEILKSKDHNLNDIPLARWEAMEPSIRAVSKTHLAKTFGDDWSLNMNTCIAKQAARMWKASYEKDQLEETTNYDMGKEQTS